VRSSCELLALKLNALVATILLLKCLLSVLSTPMGAEWFGFEHFGSSTSPKQSAGLLDRQSLFPVETGIDVH